MMLNMCFNAPIKRSLISIATVAINSVRLKGNISRFPDGIFLAMLDGTFGAAARRFYEVIRQKRYKQIQSILVLVVRFV